MIEFLSFSLNFRLVIVLLLGVCILTQTFALVVTYYRARIGKLPFFENLLEMSILLELVVFVVLYGQLMNGYKIGLVILSGYKILRITVFLSISVLAITVSYLKKTGLPLFALLAASITLPIIERALNARYPWVFIIALVLFLLRSVVICIRSIQSIRTTISALSVVQAIDTLNTGLLYSENNGRILLSNYKMQDLMISLTGKFYRNATAFFDYLVSPPTNSKFAQVELEGQMVCLLPDNTAWMFTKSDIIFHQKKYSHISASDVSEQWALTVELQQKHQVLKDGSNMLNQTIKNLHILCREKEIEHAKTRAHDVLGQRLSVMLRTIQNERDVNYDLLRSLSKGLLKELTTEERQINPDEQLKNIQAIFKEIGVDINVEGEFPKHDGTSGLFTDIIRESTTNAVRHGLATKVDIAIQQKDNEYHLIISNNGHTSTKTIAYGGGIQTIIRKVTTLGGKLEIKQHPTFKLSVIIPGGE